MDNLIYPPWFLARYQRWWAAERVALVVEVDFAVLILRICTYALQFLPSPSYTLDKIRGMLLSDICNMCDQIAGSLAAISSVLDGRGSLIRVQHLAFFGLRCQVEGRRETFWDALNRAIWVAQSVGIDSEATKARPAVNELEREMGRRTFCNLFIWDSLLSRQLDRTALLPRCLSPGSWPKMNLGIVGDANGEESSLDAFTERLLQARLADFWRRIGPVAGTGYDMMVAEERYEKLCSEYIGNLPPPFALQPNEAWDKDFPKLPLQRQLLHIALYESMCWNYRPLLTRLSQEQDLPAYKRMLLDSQKKALAIAALHVLEGVSQLHAMLGGCHTRFAGLVFSTFEAAVLLVYICRDALFPQDDSPAISNTKNTRDPDPLQAGIRNFTRQGCIEAVQGALDRLRMLAEVSNVADVGASTLTQLMSKASIMTEADDISVSQNQRAAGDIASCISFDPADLDPQDNLMATSNLSTAVGDIASWPSFDPSDSNLQGDFFSASAMQELQSSWATSMIEFDH